MLTGHSNTNNKKILRQEVLGSAHVVSVFTLYPVVSQGVTSKSAYNTISIHVHVFSSPLIIVLVSN